MWVAAPQQVTWVRQDHTTHFQFVGGEGGGPVGLYAWLGHVPLSPGAGYSMG
jgi:hypothetical protein